MIPQGSCFALGGVRRTALAGLAPLNDRIRVAHDRVALVPAETTPAHCVAPGERGGLRMGSLVARVGTSRARATRRGTVRQRPLATFQGPRCTLASLLSAPKTVPSGNRGCIKLNRTACSGDESVLLAVLLKPARSRGRRGGQARIRLPMLGGRSQRGAQVVGLKAWKSRKHNLA